MSLTMIISIILLKSATFNSFSILHLSRFKSYPKFKSDTFMTSAIGIGSLSNNDGINIKKDILAIPTVQIQPEFSSRLLSFMKDNWLVIGELLVIVAAKINPNIGRTGGILRPEFTINKIAVATIFFINGILMSPVSSTPEGSEAATKFNTLIQLFSFGFIPLVAKLLVPLYPDKSLRDGLLVLACLPTTISVCISQTQASGGDMTTAIFNAIFANTIGVFITPLLTIAMLGAGQGVSLIQTLKKLGSIVILPMIVGQLLRNTPVINFAEKLRKYSRSFSSFLLLAIVYNTFSDTFINGIGISGISLLSLLISMPLSYATFSWLFWQISKHYLPGINSKTRASGLLCSSQKTLAFGIPFIKTALGHRSDLSSILAPLLLFAPSQLIIGSSFIVPKMRKLIEKDALFEGGGGI